MWFALLAALIGVAFAAADRYGTNLEGSATPGVLMYVASPATKETRVTLRRQADRILIIDDFTHTIVAGGRADRIKRVIVRGVDGDHNDTLTVDFSGRLCLPGGIDFDGGTAGFDTLRIVGGSGTDSRHIPTNRSDGVVEVGATEIRYRNLEPVLDTIAGPLTINVAAGVGGTLQDNGSGRAQFVFTGNAFESLTFANKSSLTINIAGSATVTLAASVWADLTVAVTVNGTGSGNTLLVDLTGATSPSLPVTNTSGNLSGAWTFGNRPNLTFSGIQSLNPASLSVSKTGPSSVPLGSNISYTITVNNAGPNSAAGVTVTDPIPPNTTLVSATPSQGSCSGTATVNCSLGLIGSGGSATIALVLSVNSGAVTNTAAVMAATTDTNANNSSTSSAAVNISAVCTPVVTPVPALSTWSLVVFAALLAGYGVISRRRATG